jgi:glycosyltransferase involved in cell wall biosynthesis/GT2 family glycosyltransferase
MAGDGSRDRLVTVVVIARNEQASIEACLESCLRAAAPHQARVVLVDGRSSDRTRAIGTSRGVEVFTIPDDVPHAPSGLRAFALTLVDSRYVQFVDADMSLDPEWLVRALGYLEDHPDLAAVAGRITGPLDLDGHQRQVAANESRDPTHLVCGFYRFEVLRKVGGFDSRLLAAEDFELGCRLRGLGYRLASLPILMAVHSDRGIHGWAELSRRWRLRYPRAYGQLLWVGRGKPWWGTFARKSFRYIAVPLFWFVLLASFVIEAVFGKFLVSPILAAFALVAFGAYAVRKRSLVRATLGFASWTLSGLGGIVGTLRPGIPSSYYGTSKSAILLFSRAVYPVEVGGREIFVRDLAIQLTSRGRHVFLLTEKDPLLDVSNLEVLEVRSHPLPIVGFALFAAGAFSKVLRVRREIGLLHAHSPLINVSFAGFLSGFFGLPLVVTAHCAGVDYAFSSLAYLRASRVIAVSDAVASGLLRSGVPTGLVEVIPSVPVFPAEPGSITEARRELRIADSDFVALYLGRMDEHKGIRLLVDAIRDWPEEQPLTAILVGDGPARSSLEASLVPRAHLTVRWEGWVDHDRVGTYYRAANVFVLPSLREGSPLAIFEALHYRTPIIATDAPGIRDFLRDRENARLIPRSAEDLRSALLELRRDPALLASIRDNEHLDEASNRAVERQIELYDRLQQEPTQKGPRSQSHGADALPSPSDSLE